MYPARLLRLATAAVLSSALAHCAPSPQPPPQPKPSNTPVEEPRAALTGAMVGTPTPAMLALLIKAQGR
jgi:hypothetical protein